MTEVEETHSAALLKQKSAIEQLKSEFKAANENCNAALHAAQVAFDDKAHQLKGQHEKEVNELQGRIYKLEEDVASSSKIFQELLEQQEEEYELMISNLKAKSDSHSHKEEQVKNDITASLHSIKFERDQLARQVEELKSKSLFSDESFKREHSLRRLLENEKEELICTIYEMTSRTESETHRIHGLEKDVHASKSVERELKEKLQSIENSKTSMLTEIENLKNQQSTLEHEIRLRNKIIEEKDVARQRLESKLNSSNKEKQHLSNQTRAMKRELVLLAGMNEKELRTAIDGICTKYSR
jgi:chromosome segregation ATPase